MADQTNAMMVKLRSVFGSARISLTDEKLAQAQIGELLNGAGVAHMREHRLSATDIPDFFLPLHDDAGLVLEVKMNSAQPALIRRQLGRYAAYPQVAGVCLASNKAVHLPSEIELKPAHYISLGRAWL